MYFKVKLKQSFNLKFSFIFFTTYCIKLSDLMGKTLKLCATPLLLLRTHKLDQFHNMENPPPA